MDDFSLPGPLSLSLGRCFVLSYSFLFFLHLLKALGFALICFFFHLHLKRLAFCCTISPLNCQWMTSLSQDPCHYLCTVLELWCTASKGVEHLIYGKGLCVAAWSSEAGIQLLKVLQCKLFDCIESQFNGQRVEDEFSPRTPLIILSLPHPFQIHSPPLTQSLLCQSYVCTQSHSNEI